MVGLGCMRKVGRVKALLKVGCGIKDLDNSTTPHDIYTLWCANFLEAYMRTYATQKRAFVESAVS